MPLTESRKERYSRNILVSCIGEEGQEKLLESKVLVIGAGGLGSPNLLYLTAVGVGTLGIADSDNVELSNLQRQVLHWTDDIGKPKTESAKEKLVRINPDVKIDIYNTRVNEKNISEIIGGYDFIIECTDNLESKFLINDACVINKKPYSHCGVLVFHGQTITYTPGNACLRCIFNSPPEPDAVQKSSEHGIFGTVPGIFGSIQATEAVKYLTGSGKLLTNTLFHFDTLHLSYSSVKVKPNPECRVCGTSPEITSI